jgi:hypothetical protein
MYSTVHLPVLEMIPIFPSSQFEKPGTVYLHHYVYWKVLANNTIKKSVWEEISYSSIFYYFKCDVTDLLVKKIDKNIIFGLL